MPRLYHLVSDLGPSAGGKQLSLLAPELAGRGIQQAVGVLGGYEPFGPAIAAVAPVRRFDRWRGVFDLSLARAVRRAVAEFRPDVVAAWGPDAVWWAGLNHRFGGPPFVAVAYTISTWRFSEWAVRSAKVVLPFTNRDVWSNDPWLRLSPSRIRRIPPDRIHSLPPAAAPAPAVDPVAVRAGLGLPADARMIVAAGLDWLGESKEAVWAFDILKYTDPRLWLVVLGDGDMRGYVEEFARSIGKDDVRTVFPGLRADAPAVVAAADAVWITTRAGGCSLAAEAAAAGVPVLAFDNPDLVGLVPAADQIEHHGDRVRLAGRTAERLAEPRPAVRAFPVAATAAAFLRAVFPETSWNNRAVRAE